MGENSSRLDIRVQNPELRDALEGALRASRIHAGDDLSPAFVLTTESDTSADACAQLVGDGHKVVVLMVTASTQAQEPYVAAGAVCVAMGTPAGVLTALFDDLAGSERTRPG